MDSLHEKIAVAKRRLPLPELMKRCGLGAHARPQAFCPFHENTKTPAFGIFRDRRGLYRWKCHSQCGSGDEITLLEKLDGLPRGAAVRKYLAAAGVAHTSGAGAPMARSASPSAENRKGPQLPADATPGTEAEFCELATLRHLSPNATFAAATLGTLYFGTVCGERCWIITDERRLCAEARRMDGKPFPAIGPLAERKAHTIRGSVKSWPVGLAVRGHVPGDFRALLVVEGGPDYLAALHFALEQKCDGHFDCLPVAFLGAGAASRIHSDAVPLLRGRRVAFYPHHDPSGAGGKAVQKWAEQFAEAGALIGEDSFIFAGLRKSDGSAVKDLNDCTQIDPDDAVELEELLP
jgi:hypothetical protein